jgi:hypothetical protein
LDESVLVPVGQIARKFGWLVGNPPVEVNDGGSMQIVHSGSFANNYDLPDGTQVVQVDEVFKVFILDDDYRCVAFGDDVVEVQASGPGVEWHHRSACGVSAVHRGKEFDLIGHEQGDMAATETVSNQCLPDLAGHFVSLGEGYLRLKIDDQPRVVASLGCLIPKNT